MFSGIASTVVPGVSSWRPSSRIAFLLGWGGDGVEPQERVRGDGRARGDGGEAGGVVEDGCLPASPPGPLADTAFVGVKARIAGLGRRRLLIVVHIGWNGFQAGDHLRLNGPDLQCGHYDIDPAEALL